jgi:glycosyltransferase involved in cell wall biosynthesis
MTSSPPDSAPGAAPSIVCFATKGSGSNEEGRIISLLADHEPGIFPFDRANKKANVRRLMRHVRDTRPRLLVMEGTGTAGALALWLCRWRYGVPYVVSSGDAIAPFLTAHRRAAAPLTWLYEWLLYRWSAGFIGWTPYLVGRAMTMGARRAMTAANFTLAPEILRSRDDLRDELGIPRDAIVFGLLGAMNWNDRVGFCYGAELVRAMRHVKRDDVRCLIVGGGTGLERLRELAGDDLGTRILLPGPAPQDLVTSYLAAMDVGSLPQSVDQVGALRYTTKLSEYLTAQLPVVTSEIPLAYDLDEGWLWRVPGDTPWSETYVRGLARVIDAASRAEIAERRDAIPQDAKLFDELDQRRRVGGFIGDLLAGSGAPR